MTTTYHIADIRNIALAGHGASGKTSLADALLFAAGATDRTGSVDDGTSISDVDDEEKRRHFTIDCHLGHLAWNGKQIHLIDSPGYPDFIGNALSALAAVENVVLAVSGPSGIEVNTRRIFQEASRLGLGRFIAITKMDAENVDYRARPRGDPRDVRPPVRAVQRADRPGPDASPASSTCSSPHDDVPADCPLRPTEAYQMVVEQIVETDEDLMTRYLEGETIAARRAARGRPRRDRRRASSSRSSASRTRKDIGVKELLDLLADCGLSPDRRPPLRHPRRRRRRRGRDRARPRTATLVAQVFKTTNDLFMGKLSYLRILSGRIAPDTTLVNLRTGKTDQGRATSTCSRASSRRRSTRRSPATSWPSPSSTTCTSPTPSATSAATRPSPQLKLQPIKFPTPMVPRAVEPKTREDEPKISAGLAKIADEDPTFTYPPRHPDARAGDLGDERAAPRRDPAPAQEPLQARHQHAHPARPLPGDDHRRGRGRTTGTRSRPAAAASSPRSSSASGRASGARASTSSTRSRGASIPNQYIPAVEKGVREQMEKGVISGNPVVDVEVEVFFGKVPPGRQLGAGVQDRRGHGLPQGVRRGPARSCWSRSSRSRSPCPAAKFGDISADLSTRRGHITGMDTLPGGLQVDPGDRAPGRGAPLRHRPQEHDRGQGSFTMEFKSYEPVPPNVQQQIVEQVPEVARGHRGGVNVRHRTPGSCLWRPNATAAHQKPPKPPMPKP